MPRFKLERSIPAVVGHCQLRLTVVDLRVSQRGAKVIQRCQHRPRCSLSRVNQRIVLGVRVGAERSPVEQCAARIVKCSLRHTFVGEIWKAPSCLPTEAHLESSMVQVVRKSMSFVPSSVLKSSSRATLNSSCLAYGMFTGSNPAWISAPVIMILAVRLFPSK